MIETAKAETEQNLKISRYTGETIIQLNGQLGHVCRQFEEGKLKIQFNEGRMGVDMDISPQLD